MLDNLASTYNGQSGRLTLTVTDTAAQTNPITTATAKSWAKIDTSADDTLIGELIDEVSAAVENEYQVPIISKDVIAVWDSFAREMPLPFAPVSSITSVKTINYEGTETTLVAGTDYRITGDTLYFNKVYDRGAFYHQALQVTYVSAFATFPKDLKLGLKKAILSNYEDRQDNAVAGVELPNASRSFFNKYIRY